MVIAISSLGKTVLHCGNLIAISFKKCLHELKQYIHLIFKKNSEKYQFVKVPMPLIGNTIVFLDTSFFKEYRNNDQLYGDFFQYAKDEKIALCTSDITLEEWRTQKFAMHTKYIRTVIQDRNYHIANNFITDEMFTTIPPLSYDENATEQVSLRLVNNFMRENNITRFQPQPEHIERTWFSYFRGLPPFNAIKSRKDIPDAWIFEAARDLKDNPSYTTVKNRFCIGSDIKFQEHLEKLGLKSVTAAELVEQLKQEEAAQYAQTAGAAHTIQVNETIVTSDTVIADVPERVDSNSLDGILASALNNNWKDMYLRILGYISWTERPTKLELENYLTAHGHDLLMARAACVLLADPALGLITDSGNHYLARNNSILSEAATRIMPEILEQLERSQ